MTSTETGHEPLIHEILERRGGTLEPGWLLARCGSDRARRILASIDAAFPDAGLAVEWAVADSDAVALGGHVSGTHLGPWRGVPATGRSVSVAVALSLRVVGGEIVDLRSVADSLSLAEQLGAVVPLGPRACQIPTTPTGASDD